MRRRNERGAGIVEAALIFPIVALVTMAVIDGGIYMAARASAGNAARDAAREIAVAGTDTAADYHGLNVIKKSTSGIVGGEVRRVVIFDAADYDPELPNPCKVGNSNPGQNCNVYFPADFNRPKSDFDNTTWLGPAGWTTGERNVSRTLGTGLVGVSVTAQVNAPIGVFGSASKEVTRVLVMQMEAQQP